VDAAVGRGMFPVDEEFVKANLQGLTNEDRALMDAFVGQSLHKEEVTQDSDGGIPVKKALFRICNALPAPGDDSPLRDSLFRYRPSQRSEFAFEGQMIETDRARATKLTKVIKRRDNENKLLHAVHRMKLVK
jgi:hypothetical protein